jgi:protein-disulfide isomerase
VSLRPGVLAALAVAAVATVALTTHRSHLSVRMSEEYPARGREDAPVTLMEFTDYQCPYCRHFESDTWPVLQERYVDTGKLQFVLLDLPLDFHAGAEPAAEAAHCAGAQSGFWRMHHALLRPNQSLQPAAIEALARSQGLDPTRFQACLASGRYRDEIQRHLRLAHSLGLDGTPAFILGKVHEGELQGRAIMGTLPPAEFQNAIDQALAGH